jgi:hypothetical protein
MLRDLLTQIPRTFKRLLILDSPEHVDSENIKLILGHGPSPTLPTLWYFSIF